MQISTTFRHMEPSEALKSYAAEKLERVRKYIDEPIAAQVYLTVEKIRHIAEIALTAKGVTIKASEATSDMYAAIDAVVDKIERQDCDVFSRRPSVSRSERVWLLISTLARAAFSHAA